MTSLEKLNSIWWKENHNFPSKTEKITYSTFEALKIALGCDWYTTWFNKSHISSHDVLKRAGWIEIGDNEWIEA